MSDKIKVLPESLANQIAAGEVIQRPASVIKELTENSIDAQADKVEIMILNGGKTLIQVADNGIGMSETDARLCFERHATSKIKSTEDLFNITTKGFRGEALASIAAVAKVELKTRRENDMTGTRIVIEGSRLITQEPVQCPKGANFSVKSLFFNVPARRRFLKSDSTEFKHILTEFYRLAIPHFNIQFKLYHNNNLIFSLKKSTLKERIINLFDKNYSKFLVPLELDAKILKISGFITKPEFAKRTKAEQYFFVNGRFMKNAYFHKAVIEGYGQLLPPETKPVYFIFFEIDPAKIDVNIHPTKTEINFENASQIYNILSSSIRTALTKYEITPSIDFENAEFLNLENDTKDIRIPDFPTNPQYNPFDLKIKNKEKKFEQIETLFETDKFLPQNTTQQNKFFIFNEKFLITSLKSGMLIIHIPRAYEQINYEEILNAINNKFPSQVTLYPVKIDLTAEETMILKENLLHFKNLGFEIISISQNSFNITAIPPFLTIDRAAEFILNAINYQLQSEQNLFLYHKEKIAELLAKSSVKKIKSFSTEEYEDLLAKLFSCKSTDYTFDGRRIIKKIDSKEIEKMF